MTRWPLPEPPPRLGRSPEPHAQFERTLRALDQYGRSRTQPPETRPQEEQSRCCHLRPGLGDPARVELTEVGPTEEDARKSDPGSRYRGMVEYTEPTDEQPAQELTVHKGEEHPPSPGRSDDYQGEEHPPSPGQAGGRWPGWRAQVGALGNWFVAADFLSRALPKNAARDFQNYQELQSHHDSLMLDTTLDNAQQMKLRRHDRQIRCCSGCLSVLAGLILLGVTVFSIVGLVQATPDIQVHVEYWNEGEFDLCPVAFAIPSGYSVKVEDCRIENGVYATKECSDVTSQITDCSNTPNGPPKSSLAPIGSDGHPMVCLPSGLQILGVYGDPVYSYVEVKYLADSCAGTTCQGATNVATYETLMDPGDQQWFIMYDTWAPAMETRLEIFLQKRSFRLDGVDTLSKAYSIDPRAYDEGPELDFTRTFKRLYGCGGDGTCASTNPDFVPYSFILRAELKSEQLHGRYLNNVGGVVSTLGGLYTGLLFVFAAVIVCTFYVGSCARAGCCGCCRKAAECCTCALCSRDEMTKSVVLKQDRGFEILSPDEKECNLRNSTQLERVQAGELFLRAKTTTSCCDEVDRDDGDVELKYETLLALHLALQKEVDFLKLHVC